MVEAGQCEITMEEGLLRLLGRFHEDKTILIFWNEIWNEIWNKIWNKIWNVLNPMHMKRLQVAKFGNGPARRHRNPKLWILTKLVHSKCITAPQMTIFAFWLVN